METVKHELNVPKQSKEVIDLLDGIVVKIKAKAPVSEYLELVNEFMAAVEDVKEVGDEIKSGNKGDILAYLTMKIGSHF